MARVWFGRWRREVCLRVKKGCFRWAIGSVLPSLLFTLHLHHRRHHHHRQSEESINKPINQSYCLGFHPFISLGKECSIFELLSKSPRIVSVLANKLS